MASITQGAGPLGCRGVPAPCKGGISHAKVSSLPCGGSRIVAMPYCARGLTALPPPARRRVPRNTSIVLNFTEVSDG